TISSSNSLFESLKSENSDYQDEILEVITIDAKNNFYYKDPLYRDEIKKIIDSQNNLRLASYDTLKDNVTTLQEFLDNESYKYFSDSVWGLEIMINNANSVFSEYESIISSPITVDDCYCYWYGNTPYEMIYNRNTKLVELNEQFVSMNTEINYMSKEDPYTGWKYGLMPIELGNVDMDYRNKTTLSDIVYVLRNILGTTTFDERQQYAGDINEDGTISLQDAVLMQRKVLGV
ncbi:MAG: dockerin type I repeat-containing protein, partial [Acutalibacteraceae bacterium]|nr:dockerin type I repeat-containing protein [Acutalibacteraceae bacterium]